MVLFELQLLLNLPQWGGNPLLQAEDTRIFSESSAEPWWHWLDSISIGVVQMLQTQRHLLQSVSQDSPKTHWCLRLEIGDAKFVIWHFPWSRHLVRRKPWPSWSSKSLVQWLQLSQLAQDLQCHHSLKRNTYRKIANTTHPLLVPALK